MQQQPIQGPPGQFNPPSQEVPGPTVLVTANPQKNPPPFSKKPAAILSSVQIFLGCVSFLAQVITIIIMESYDGKKEYYSSAWGMGEGIYCGLFFIIAGILGLFTSRKPTSCKISAFMILSIFASIFSFILIVSASSMLSYYNRNYSSYSYRYYSYYDGYNQENGNSGDPRQAYMAMYSIMVLAGVTELVISIISSSICCRACCGETESTTGKVVYLVQGQQGSGIAPVQVVGGAPGSGITTVQMAGVAPAPFQITGDVPAPVQMAGGAPSPLQMDSFPQTPTEVSGQKWNEPLSDGYMIGDQREIGDGYGNGGYMRLEN